MNSRALRPTGTGPGCTTRFAVRGGGGGQGPRRARHASPRCRARPPARAEEAEGTGPGDTGQETLALHDTARHGLLLGGGRGPGTPHLAAEPGLPLVHALGVRRHELQPVQHEPGLAPRGACGQAPHQPLPPDLRGGGGGGAWVGCAHERTWRARAWPTPSRPTGPAGQGGGRGGRSCGRAS
jgi:hypothetical protein